MFGAISAKAQIPTTDAIAAAQRTLNITNAIAQLEQMKAQVTALTGNLGVGTSYNAASLHSYLPDQWESVYSKVQNGQLTGLSNATTQILQQEGLANAPTAGQQQINNTLAANKAMAQAAYDASIARLQNIQALMQQSNLTQDASQKADLNNRLQAELAMVQNEQTRLNLATQLQQAQMQIAQQQAHNTNRNALLGLDSNGNALSNSGVCQLGVTASNCVQPTGVPGDMQ
jgi:type IV secretion system protein VirB5